MPVYQLTHVTTVDYAMPVAASHHSGYLRPLDLANQSVRDFSLVIAPHPIEMLERIDYFDNRQLQFQIEERHQTLEVTSRSTVQVTKETVTEAASSPSCDSVRSTLAVETTKEILLANLMTHPTRSTRAGEALDAFGAAFLGGDRPYLEAALALNTAVYEGFQFDPHATDLSTPVDEVFEQRRGVCQDFAHLMLSCLRAQRLPACYVSGYILTHPPEGQDRLEGADASHAWVRVWIPELGWIDLDPTNNKLCGDEYITVACGRDYADVNPLRGAVSGGGEHEITIAVTMTPLLES